MRQRMHSGASGQLKDYTGLFMKKSRSLRRSVFIGFLAYLVAFFNPVIAEAANVPAFNGRMNNALSSLIQAKVGKMGFAGNDPRFGATVGAVGTAATTIAAGVATGALATVGWPALLVSAGVSALVSGAMSLGVDGLVNWIWGDSGHDKQVQLGGNGMGTGDPSLFPVIPGSYPAILSTYGSGADVWFKSSPTGTDARHIRTVLVSCPGSVVFCGAGTAVSTANMDATLTAVFSGTFPGSTGGFRNVYRAQVSTTGTTVTYQIVFDFTPASGVTLLPPAYTSTWKSAVEAVNDLPATYASTPLSDQMLATALNTLWKTASVTDPNVIPWSASNPVTPADVAAWRSANPSMVPTVNDFISPVAAPGDSAVVLPVTGQGVVTPSVPGSAPTPVTVDFGADPHTPAPVLEVTPTASSILSPLFALMPDLKNFTVPAHASTCPTGTFSAMGSTYVISSHCDLIEANRSVIEAAMLLVFTISAVVIVLRA
jgi:hypothetical protein